MKELELAFLDLVRLSSHVHWLIGILMEETLSERLSEVNSTSQYVYTLWGLNNLQVA